MSDITFRDRDRIERTAAHGVALDCLAAGIEAALPANVVADAVSVADGTLRIAAVDGETAAYDLDAYRTVRIVGAGKAADGVAAALADRLGDPLGDRFAGGTVITDEPDDGDGPAGADPPESSEQSGADSRLDVLPGDHPLPTERGVEHASALLAAPADPLGVDDLRELTDALLACGASIDEINAVRKHCSAVKGGLLARTAAPATVVTLAVSDVVGDDPAVIGSGPTVPDPSTYDDALE
ncbi:glycerate-2-kinase family protein, partial [Halorubrum halodurans]